MGKKLVAPIIITIFSLCFMLFYYGLIFALIPLSFWIKALIGILPLSLGGVSIFVLVERIKEIRSGEEDDLSKY